MTVEQESQDNATEPRITPERIERCIAPEHIDRCIVRAQYHVFPDTTVTVCALHLKNGFVVTGESACAWPEHFDPEFGRRVAYDNARQKIWQLEGYLLRERLSNPQFQAD